MNPINPLVSAPTSNLGPLNMFQTPAALGESPDSNVAAEFESVLLSLLVNNLRKSSFGEGLFPGDKSDTLGGMFDMMIAGQMSESGGVGVRNLVDRWLSDQTARAVDGGGLTEGEGNDSQ